MPKIVALKEDWLKLGYTLFSESGKEGLNVDKMSRVLQCNKSSFYWHFKTKKDFIDSLIEYWIDIDTKKIIEEVNLQKSPRQQLISLIHVAFKKDSNLDFIFYLKKYAQQDKKIAKIVANIDSERILFVQNLLTEMGYSADEAEIKASIFYKYLIGYHEMIRYKNQKKNYLTDVLNELSQFIKL